MDLEEYHLIDPGGVMEREIMIVDDDKMVVFLHTMVIKEHHPVSPFVAYNGKDALEHILKSIDENKNYIVFLDLNMPYMDGWQFLEEIKNQKLEGVTKVAIVSSSVDYRDKIKSKEYENVICFIEKPLAPTDYIKILEGLQN